MCDLWRESARNAKVAGDTVAVVAKAVIERTRLTGLYCRTESASSGCLVVVGNCEQQEQQHELVAEHDQHDAPLPGLISNRASSGMPES